MHVIYLFNWRIGTFRLYRTTAVLRMLRLRPGLLTTSVGLRGRAVAAWTPTEAAPPFRAGTSEMCATVQLPKLVASNSILHKLPNRRDFTNGKRGRGWAIVRGIFDSESLNLMQATLEHALAALPPEQQTFETRERIAQAILSFATQWESDQDQSGALSIAERMSIYLGAVS